MAHKPRRTVGADLKLPLQLERAHLRLAGAHHVEADQPFVERDMRVLADRADRHREALKAFGTLVEPGANFLLWIRSDLVDALLIRVAAMRANRAVRPAQLLEILASRFLGREPLRICMSVRSPCGFLPLGMDFCCLAMIE